MAKAQKEFKNLQRARLNFKPETMRTHSHGQCVGTILLRLDFAVKIALPLTHTVPKAWPTMLEERVNLKAKSKT